MPKEGRDEEAQKPRVVPCGTTDFALGPARAKDRVRRTSLMQPPLRGHFLPRTNRVLAEVLQEVLGTHAESHERTKRCSSGRQSEISEELPTNRGGPRLPRLSQQSQQAVCLPSDQRAPDARRGGRQSSREGQGFCRGYLPQKRERRERPPGRPRPFI